MYIQQKVLIDSSHLGEKKKHSDYGKAGIYTFAHQ